MKFSQIEVRIAAMETAREYPEEAENDEILMQIWQEHFEKHLTELGLSDLISEVKPALLTVGPRPFGYERPDDRPIWSCIKDVSFNHQEHAYRIRDADSLAWADMRIDLGDSEG